jgi:hypothetical protein
MVQKGGGPQPGSPSCPNIRIFTAVFSYHFRTSPQHPV